MIWMWIILIATWGGLFLFLWYRKNGEKIKTKRAEKNIKNSGLSLQLASEKIEDFLNSNEATTSTEAKEAFDYLALIRSMFRDAVWMIDSQNAVLRTKNRTKDNLLSVRGTCDLLVSGQVFYTVDFTRSNIPANGFIEIKQDIMTEYSNAVGAIGSIVGAFSKKLGPKTEGRFRNYEIQLSERHYLFNNPVIRKLAGEKPIEKNKNNYDIFVDLTSSLNGEAQSYAQSIIATLHKSIQYTESHKDAKEKVWEYIDKYIPTIISAVQSYRLDNSEASEENLTRTLDIMDKATENFYTKLIENDVDLSEVNQAVLEHQLMREGLYSPYDEEFLH